MNPLLILVNPRCQPLGHSTYLRARAEEVRCIADDMRDPVSKRMMLQIAGASEVMAKDAEFPGSATSGSRGGGHTLPSRPRDLSPDRPGCMEDVVQDLLIRKPPGLRPDPS